MVDSPTLPHYHFPILKGSQLLWLHVCFPAQQIPFKNWSALKGKDFLIRSEGKKCLPFRVDHFQKGEDNFDKWKCIYFS